MDQYDRLTRTMILVVEINIPGILHPNIDEVLKPRCNTGQTSGCGGACGDVPAGLDDLFADPLS